MAKNRVSPTRQPSADPEGGTGGPDPPWKITSYMGFYRELAIGPPLEKTGPPWKMLVPRWNLVRSLPFFPHVVRILKLNGFEHRKLVSQYGENY